MSNELTAAVLKGEISEARALLVAGADPKIPVGGYPPIWEVVFDWGHAPLLHLATLTGNAPMVRLLLEHGVDVNERPSFTRHYQTHDDTYEVPGQSALELAVSKGFLVVADVLLEAGARLDDETAKDLKRAQRAAKEGSRPSRQ